MIKKISLTGKINETGTNRACRNNATRRASNFSRHGRLYEQFDIHLRKFAGRKFTLGPMP
jgi:hypothetical protein